MASSYEGVTWTITAAPGTTITDVILSGYDLQTAVVPMGTTVDNHSGPGMALSSSAYQWNDASTAQLVAAVEGLTGAAITSFHGCYQGSDFTIE